MRFDCVCRNYRYKGYVLSKLVEDRIVLLVNKYKVPVNNTTILFYIQ